MGYPFFARTAKSDVARIEWAICAICILSEGGGLIVERRAKPTPKSVLTSKHNAKNLVFTFVKFVEIGDEFGAGWQNVVDEEVDGDFRWYMESASNDERKFSEGQGVGNEKFFFVDGVQYLAVFGERDINGEALGVAFEQFGDRGIGHVRRGNGRRFICLI